MDYLACPSCGSTYFVSSRSGEKSVFHVDENSDVVLLDQGETNSGKSMIDVLAMFCGACSWSGAIEQLVESHM